jgi:hypothetical protein
LKRKRKKGRGVFEIKLCFEENGILEVEVLKINQSAGCNQSRLVYPPLPALWMVGCLDGWTERMERMRGVE